MLIKTLNNNDGGVKELIQQAINLLFQKDDNLSNELDYRTYEALEKAITFQCIKKIDLDKKSK